jgi:hypothetical protein
VCTNSIENVEWVFNHKSIHKYTWEQHAKNLKTIIDYIITKEDLKLKIQDFRVYREPNCGTDHKFFVAKILFPYMDRIEDKHEEKKQNTVKVVDKKRKYNIESLQNESTKFLYQQRQNNKLNRNEFADTEEMYNCLNNVSMKQKRKHWEKKKITKEGKHLFGMQK